METAERVTDQVNGKKSYLGAILMGIGNALTAYGMPEYGEPLRIIGETLLGVGIAHKLAKAAS